MDTVPLVAVLGRFDCKTDTYNVDTVPLVSVLMRFDCDTDTCVMWNSIPLVAVLRRFDCKTDTSIMGIFCFFGICIKEI